MNDSTDKKKFFESHLFSLLDKIKKSAGSYLGEASLTKLSQFISGYIYAAYDFDICDYGDLDFERDFDTYIKKKVPGRDFTRWDRILCEGKTEEEAFADFFKELDCFIKEKNSQNDKNS